MDEGWQHRKAWADQWVVDAHMISDRYVAPVERASWELDTRNATDAIANYTHTKVQIRTYSHEIAWEKHRGKITIRDAKKRGQNGPTELDKILRGDVDYFLAIFAPPEGTYPRHPMMGGRLRVHDLIAEYVQGGSRPLPRQERWPPAGRAQEQPGRGPAVPRLQPVPVVRLRRPRPQRKHLAIEAPARVGAGAMEAGGSPMKAVPALGWVAIAAGWGWLAYHYPPVLVSMVLIIAGSVAVKLGAKK